MKRNNPTSTADEPKRPFRLISAALLTFELQQRGYTIIEPKRPSEAKEKGGK